MRECIFAAHCIESVCDRSCPILAETSYLLERNGISESELVYILGDSDIIKYKNILNKSDKLITYITNNTVDESIGLTYVAICENWRNSRLHCVVYNLRYSQYLDELKRSWGGGSESEILEYMRIWISSAKILIISHLDYVNFGDFESQTLLLIMQERLSKNQRTIIISPKIESLVSSKISVFFNSLKAKLSSSVKVVNIK